MAPLFANCSASCSEVCCLFHNLTVLVLTNRACCVVQVRKLFQQLFSFVNVQLFNQLLLRRECCSFSNGEYVKTGLAEVENWIHSAGKDWTGESWDELRYIRQVCSHFQPSRAALHRTLPSRVAHKLDVNEMTLSARSVDAKPHAMLLLGTS